MAKRAKAKPTVATSADLDRLQQQIANLQKLLVSGPALNAGRVTEIARHSMAEPGPYRPQPPSVHRPALPLKRAGGRRVGDPEDARNARIGLRVHEDLRTELEKCARAQGLLLSLFIERCLVRGVNDHYGIKVLDVIGRYTGEAQGR